MVQNGSLMLMTFLCCTDVRFYKTQAFQNTIPIHHAATRSALFRRRDDQGNAFRPNSNVSSRSRSLSPLPLNIFHRLRRIRFNHQRSNSQRTSSSSALNMVFTTPSSVIEQASTKILLDDLIDESVRSVPRTSVMMQFDPSSGWVCTSWNYLYQSFGYWY